MSLSSSCFPQAREKSRVFGKGIEVEFQLLDKLDKDQTGKLRKIVSHVPPIWR
jgi:hypothetical protein